MATVSTLDSRLDSQNNSKIANTKTPAPQTRENTKNKISAEWPGYMLRKCKEI